MTNAKTFDDQLSMYIRWLVYRSSSLRKAESRKHWKCTYLELLIKIYPDQSGCTLEYCNVEFFFFNAIHVDKN